MLESNVDTHIMTVRCAGCNLDLSQEKKGSIVKKSRKIIIGVVVVAVIGLIVVGLVRKSKSQSKHPADVRIEQPQVAELIEFVSAPGEIEPKSKVSISAKVSARIIDLPYKEGAAVTAGDPNAEPPIPASVLIRLDSKDLESQLRSTEARWRAEQARIEVQHAQLAAERADLVALEASLLRVQQDFNRQKQLYLSKDISQSDFDLARQQVDELDAKYEAAKYRIKGNELNLVVSQHNLESQRAQVEEAQEKIGYTVIESPMTGTITRINIKVGETVTGTINNPGTVIMEVADLSRMLVVAEVGEADVGKLKVKQKAKVEVQAYPDDVYYGYVEAIALTHRLSPNGTKYFRTEILLNDDPNVSRLYSGLTAQVEIETLRHPDVLIVPSQAVLGRPVDNLPLKIREDCNEVDKEKTISPVVYRMQEGKAIVTPVRIGPSNLTHTIIKAGLKAEDKVIVGPYRVLDGLSHEQAVRDERAHDKKDPNKPAPDANDAGDVNDAHAVNDVNNGA